jgi:acyl carrier protein
MNKLEAVQLVIDSLKSMPDYPIKDITEDTPLASRDAMTLDSFGLTSLVIDLEQRVFEKYNKSIQIVSDKMYSINNSPLRTVGTLSEFLVELMK